MTRNTAVVWLNAIHAAFSLAIVAGALYVAINYTLWGLLLMILLAFMSNIPSPTDRGAK